MSKTQTSFINDETNINDKTVPVDLVTIEGEQFYKMSNSNRMLLFL